jgi:alcohol dehydrogenase
MEAAFAATRRGGVTVAMGLPHPDRTINLNALAFAGQAKSLLGSYMGSANPARDIPYYLELWRAGRLPVEQLLTSTLPLSQVNEALDALADGTAIRQILRPHS